MLIDREQGGSAHLDKNGLKLHAAFTLSYIVDTLLAHKLLSQEIVDAVKGFIAENQTSSAVAGACVRYRLTLWSLSDQACLPLCCMLVFSA